VDGVQDPVWAGANEIATNTWVFGTSGATARVKTLWDSGSLYVFAHVTDTLLSRASANPWEQDSVEVFLDQDNQQGEPVPRRRRAVPGNYENTQTFGGSATAARIVSATRGGVTGRWRGVDEV
jgi:endo-1,4-beta-xylanase